MKLLRSVLAPIAGYAVIVALTMLLFATLPPFRVDAASWVLAAGTLGAVVAGLSGGAVAAGIAPARRFLLGAAVLTFLVIDTTVVLLRGRSPDPLWFDLGGAAMLMAATVAGAWLVAKRRETLSVA